MFNGRQLWKAGPTIDQRRACGSDRGANWKAPSANGPRDARLEGDLGSLYANNHTTDSLLVRIVLAVTSTAQHNTVARMH